jgi:putative ATP-binding cassette transporter
MTTLVFLLKRSWRLVSLAVVAGVVSGLSAAGVIEVVSAATAGATDLATRAWQFIVLSALAVASKWLSEVLLIRLGQDAIAEVRVQLSRSIIAAPLRRSEELGGHRLLAALHDDAAVITQAYVYLPMLCVNGATVLGCLVVLGVSSLWALLVVVAAMLLGGAVFASFERRARGHFTGVRNTSDRLFQHFRALTGGIKELKMDRARGERFVSTLLSPSARAYERDFVAGMTTYSFATAFGTLLSYLVLGASVFLLPTLAGMTPKAGIGATLTLLYLMAPFALLMEVVPSVARAGVALTKWRELGLSLLPERAFVEGTLAKGLRDWQRLDLVGVTHRYYREREEGSFCLGPVDLTFRPGELVFLVGGNGSGKTSLAMVLLGLYSPDSGAILLDGRPVSDENRGLYRELFSVVFAEYHLFGDLLDLHNPETLGLARHYLHRLELDHRVQVEQGALVFDGLSQGQKKRLALLIASLEDRPFYVFDEWASDQDPRFRRVFYTELLPELRARGKTVLVVTHDDQYFAVADRCLRMDFGQVSEAAAPAHTHELTAQAR